MSLTLALTLTLTLSSYPNPYLSLSPCHNPNPNPKPYPGPNPNPKQVISAVTGTAGGVTALVMPALCYRHFCCADRAEVTPAAQRQEGAEARLALIVAIFGAVGFVYSLGNVVWTATMC